MSSIKKGADLNNEVQGGQLYWAFPYSKASMGASMMKKKKKY
jgi:hypothetical protein